MRYEKLRPNLYSADLVCGKIDLDPSHRFSCYFIVQHTDDPEFIKKQAMQLLLAGCRNFDFFGEKEILWHNGFDDVDIMLNPDSTEETVALTMSWNTIDAFVDALDVDISASPLIPHDVYLLYDDSVIYRDVLQRLERCHDGILQE